MIFTPRAKRFSLKLCDDRGIPLKLPRKIKVRFDTIHKPASFQFFVGKNPISPIFTQIEDIRGFKTTATLKSGEKVTFDFETYSMGKPYAEKFENVYFGKNGEIMFDDISGKEESYVLDKKNLKNNFDYGYFLRSLVGVRNREGKCAILDTYSKELITDFIFNSNDYDVVGLLNADTSIKYDRYMVFETTPDKKEDAEKNLKKFVIVSEEGDFVKEITANKLLWSTEREEKQPDGSIKKFSYAAFLETDKKGEFQTKLLKIDLESNELAREIEVPCIADISLQKGNRGFISTQDEELVLITENPAKKPSKGAYLIGNDGKVQTLLDNNFEIEYFGSYKNGRYLEYKGAQETGKIALNDKAKTIRVNRAEFASLARKFFGTRASAASKQTEQPVNENSVQNNSNKNPEENGPSGNGMAG